MNIDIFSLLIETDEKEKKKRREALLSPLGIKEVFIKGKIIINKRICHGIECKLCIKACPTYALYWRAGEVEKNDDLCIYCGACVLNCMVDNCIKIERERPEGESENFKNPSEFVMLQHKINGKKRKNRLRSISPKQINKT